MGSCCSVIVFHSSPPGLGEVTVNVTPASPQADAPLTSSTPNSLTRPPSQPRSRISISTTKHDSSHNPASRHRFASAPQPNPINRILSKQSLFQLRAGIRYRSSAIPRPDTSGHSGSRLSRPGGSDNQQGCDLSITAFLSAPEGWDKIACSDDEANPFGSHEVCGSILANYCISLTLVDLGSSWWGRYVHAALRQLWVKLMRPVITESLREILAHRCRL